MNKVVILSELARTIAGMTQSSAEEAEVFVRETFRLAAQRLEADKRVEIPGVGVFAVTDNNISFAPAAEFAAELNAPFSAFEAIELPDDYCEVEESTESTESMEGEVQEANESESFDADEAIAEAAEFEETEDAVGVDNAEPAATSPLPLSEPQPLPEPVESVAGPERKNSTYYHWIWAAACLLCFALGWFARDFKPEPQPELPVLPGLEALNDTANKKAEVNDVKAPEDEPVEDADEPVVTDTIAAGRFLTTMARIHYGRMEFWVYIYEANAGKLGHPDRLSAGTVVVIPSAKSLGLNPNDPAQVAAAERKAAEIYARFN